MLSFSKVLMVFAFWGLKLKKKRLMSDLIKLVGEHWRGDGQMFIVLCLEVSIRKNNGYNEIEGLNLGTLTKNVDICFKLPRVLRLIHWSSSILSLCFRSLKSKCGEL